MDHLTLTQPSSSSRNSSPAGSNYSESSVNMAKPATDKAKVGKRKGTRSVSTLTPSQLARKRANDREAQRAIRARTKEHIENLEKEIDELRSQQSQDQTVRDLLGKNRALEEEVRRLRESLGIRSARHGLPYPNSYHGSGSQPSPYDHSTTPEYPMVSDLPPYSNVHDTTSVWPASVPCSLPSTVSSPSSPAAPDEYSSNYFPANTSSAILERSSIPPTMNSPAASCMTNSDIGFDDVKSEYGCAPQISIVPISPTYQHPPWSVYPVYY
ncbi:putative bzip transcription factor [Rosellinia necatrix]|uniref:Putative bzip transcription factor n=1 Tax=Rosellinia necatrix TaxID=77044 RepID=A0A1S7URG7_ROSNE|nr:putative bzip transcription factor [Rosellinia necatrix]